MMSSDDNLIDFSSDELLIPTTSQVSLSISESNITPASSLPFDTPKGEKSIKSFFAITRQETTNEIAQNVDSTELNDTLSEMQKSTLSSIFTDNISYSSDIVKHLEEKNSRSCTEEEQAYEKALSPNHLENSFSTSTPIHVSVTTPTIVSVSENNLIVSPSASTTNQNSVTSAHSCAEPPSRFRIVKIAKAKPYDKGKWVINDYSDFQKQSINDCENISSNLEKKVRGSQSSDEHKDIAKTVASLIPRKTWSNDSIVHTVFSTVQSRAESYSTNNFPEKVLIESASSFHNPGQSTHHVIPVVEALDTAMDQIQQIRDAMIHAVTDEMRTLQESLSTLQIEYNKLKEENLILKGKLAVTEERLRELDKG